MAQTILDGGGDYVLALKENWPATHAAVAEFFAAPPPEAVIHRYQSVDGDHGRIETRRYAVCHEIAWLIVGPKHPDAFDFPGLAALGCVESETERDGKILRKRRFYLCSTPFDVETFARATRGHCADSGFCREALLAWCKENRVDFGARPNRGRRISSPTDAGAVVALGGPIGRGDAIAAMPVPWSAALFLMADNHSAAWRNPWQRTTSARAAAPLKREPFLIRLMHRRPTRDRGTSRFDKKVFKTHGAKSSRLTSPVGFVALVD